MEVKSFDRVEVKCIGEKGEYSLFLPVGAPIEEALQAASQFAASLSALNEKHKKEKAEAEEKKEENAEEEPPAEE